MRSFRLAAALAATLLPGAAWACSHESAGLAPWRVADSSGPAKAPDTTAYPNSPNGSPATGENGKPVVTDHAACGTVQGARCDGSPAPSGKADTSDTSTSKTTVSP